MKGRVSLWLKVGLCFCFIAFTGVHFPVEAQTQKVLAIRTQLRPVGWAKNVSLWFAPGICWLDDFDGGVESGTLDQTAELKIWNSNGRISFGPGFIKFEHAGGVKEGTLLADTDLCVVNTTSKSKISLKFKGGKTVEFGYDGCVMKGTLAQAATLNSEDGGSKTYPPGTLVDFDGAGLVTMAILPPSGLSPLDGGGDKPVLRLDLSPLDNVRTNQTFTLTATVENIPSLITKLEFHWDLDRSAWISSDPPWSDNFLAFTGRTNDVIQYIAPVNGKATCSVTIKADGKTGTDLFSFHVQEVPWKAGGFILPDTGLGLKKEYTIR